MPIFSSSVRPKCDLTATGYKCFSTAISQERLASVQSLIGEDEVLLVVCGIDSHFNQGSQQVFNYLLFNVNQKRAAEIERTKLDDEHFDDVALAIYKRRVLVYLNPVNYWFYLPYLACWPGLEIHCAQDQLFDDQDAMEDFKMQFLVQAVANCKSACVAFHGKDHLPDSAAFSPMLIEKWPLIQAYAIEGFGAGTFFTLKHQVRDVSREMHAVLQYVDAVVVEQLSDKSLKSFKHQFDSTFQALDYLAGRNDPTLLTTDKSMEQLIEPFSSYARHEAPIVGANARGATQATPSTQAYLAFDTRTSALQKLQQQISTTSSSGGGGQPSVGSNKPAVGTLPATFIIHAVDRTHSLACTRTGFLHWQLSAEGSKKQLQTELNTFNRDLDHVYSRMAEVVRSKVLSMNAESNFDALEQDLTTELSNQLGIPAALLSVSTQQLQPRPSADSKCQPGVPHLRSVTCFAHDLTPESLDESRGWCGSVGLGDTYFIVGGDSSSGSQLLTGQIPTACHWTGDVSAVVQRHLASAASADAAADDAANETSAGGPPLAELQALVDGPGGDELQLTCICLRRGRLLLYGARECPDLLAPKAVRLLAGGGGDSLDRPCRLAVEFLDDQAPLPPPHLLMMTTSAQAQSQRLRLRLRLPAGGRAKRDFFAKVAPVWRAEGFLVADSEEAADLDDPEAAAGRDDEAEASESAAEGAILVWGHLGSYAETLAEALTVGGSRPLVDLLHCASPQAAADALESAATAPAPVILCPHLVSPEALLQCAATGAAAVSAVIVCVNAATVVTSGRCRLQFGVLDCLADGRCSALVLTTDDRDDRGATSEAAESEVTRLFRLTNQSAKVVRAPAGRLVGGGGAASLTPPEVPTWRRLLQRRRLRPQRPEGAAAFELPDGLARVAVEFRRPLDRDRLAERLKTLGAGGAGGGGGGVKFVYLSGSAAVMRRAGAAATGAEVVHFWRHCSSSSVGGWVMKKVATAPPAGRVVAFGQGIIEDDLKRLLRLCAPLRPTKRALMIRADLTPAAVARIHKEHHLDPLPEGWFYNGTKFISFDGESSKTHPRLEQFLEAHIAQENKKVAEFNAKLNESDWQDLFSG